MEVPAKEGMMHLQVVKFGKKTWRRAWAILFPPSLTGIGRLELYNMRDGGVGDQGPAYKQALKGTDKRVIRLDDCLSISHAPEEACPRDCSAFYLNTTQRTYTLAAPAPHDWMPIICQHAFQRKDRSPALRNRDHSPEPSMSENELYSSWSSGEFQVSVQWTEAAARCNLAGPYLLSVSREALTLQDPSTAQPLYCWPYRLLRRFGQDKDSVSIEAGRRCDSGEGQFTFLSHSAAQILKAIEDGIRYQSVSDTRTSADSGRAAQKHPVSHPQTRSTPTLPPRNAATSRLPQSQPSLPPPPDDSEAELYSMILPPGGLLAHYKSQSFTAEEEEEEEKELQQGDEERLCSIESLCLFDRDGIMSPLYDNMYKQTEGDGEGEKERGEEENEVRQEAEAKLNPSNSDVYTMVSFNKPRGKAQTSVVSTCEIPIDFKQKLSNLLSKDLAKVQPSLPPRQEY